MRKIFILLAVLVLTGCGNDNPEQVADRFIQSLVEGKNQEAYNLLSKTDQEYMEFSKFTEKPFGKNPEVESFGELFGNSSQNPSVLFSAPYNQAVKFKIISSEQQNGAATINLSITGVDLAALVRGAFADILELAKKSKDEVAQDIERKVKDDDFPKITINWKLYLRKEGDVWRVFMDYALMDRQNQLIESAKDFEKNKNWIGARKSYEEFAELNSDNVEAISAIKKLDKTIATEKAVLASKNEYVGKIKLLDFIATRIDTYTDKQVPAIQFRLKNEGDRTLNKVQIVVYFSDKQGNVIFEKDYTPVSTESWNSENNKPLKPGYIWSMGKGKYYTLEKVPEEWSGKATAKITDIKFAETD